MPVNVGGDRMKMMGQVNLNISHRGTTIRATALVGEKLSHKMILSWRVCKNYKLCQICSHSPEQKDRLTIYKQKQRQSRRQ